MFSSTPVSQPSSATPPVAPTRPSAPPTPTPTPTASAPQAPVRPQVAAPASAGVAVPQVAPDVSPRQVAALQGQIRDKASVQLTGQIQQLKDSTFSNSVSKFFHKVVGSETYSNYRSQKAAMREVSSLQTEASALRVTGKPADLTRANNLDAKVTLLKNPVRGGQPTETQRAAINQLMSNDAGVQMLAQMAGIKGVRTAEQVQDLAKRSTSDSMAQQSPLGKAMLSQHVSPQELVANQKSLQALKDFVGTEEAGFMKTFYARLDPNATLDDRVKSQMFTEFMRCQGNELDIAFMESMHRMANSDTLPTMADLTALKDKCMNTEYRGGFAAGSEQLNIQGSTLQRFKDALASGNLSNTMAALKACCAEMHTFYHTSGHNQFEKFVSGESNMPFVTHNDLGQLGLTGKNYAEVMHILTGNSGEIPAPSQALYDLRKAQVIQGSLEASGLK